MRAKTVPDARRLANAHGMAVGRAADDVHAATSKRRVRQREFAEVERIASRIPPHLKRTGGLDRSFMLDRRSSHVSMFTDQRANWMALCRTSNSNRLLPANSFY